jgi:hypothetical protein
LDLVQSGWFNVIVALLAVTKDRVLCPTCSDC